jgi:hypothetical protein
MLIARCEVNPVFQRDSAPCSHQARQASPIHLAPKLIAVSAANNPYLAIGERARHHGIEVVSRRVKRRGAAHLIQSVVGLCSIGKHQRHVRGAERCTEVMRLDAHRG